MNNTTTTKRNLALIAYLATLVVGTLGSNNHNSNNTISIGLSSTKERQQERWW